MDRELRDSFERLLQQTCDAQTLRKVHAQADASAIWSTLADSGFADALIPEKQGGAGLNWAQVWPILFVAGRHGLDVPFGQTLGVRALLAHIDQDWQADAIYASCGFAHVQANGQMTAREVAGALVADVFVLQSGATLFQVSRDQCELEALEPGIGLQAQVQAHAVEVLGSLEPGALARINALILAVQLAGAADRALELTLQYAGEREQFGRAIGRFQAIQQQITQMTEQVYLMRMASQLGCHGQVDVMPNWSHAAVAKAQTSQWASAVARTAHAVHGAIGVTQEHDLQLVSRNLYFWARSQGAASYWGRQLGQQVLESEAGLLDFMRQDLFGSATLGLQDA